MTAAASTSASTGNVNASSSSSPLAAGPQCKVGTACGATCIDTQTATTDCGVCGHACLGGTCTAGTCGDVVLMTGQLTPTSVVVVGTRAYTINSTNYVFKIETVPLAGGEQTIVADKLPNRSNTLVADSDSLYFGSENGKTSGGGAVYRLPLDGGKIQTLWRQDYVNVFSVALGQDDVYFQTDAYIGKVSKMGGKMTMLTGVGSSSPGLKLHGDFLYFAGAESIFQVPIAGGKARKLAKLQNAPHDPVVDDAFVYYATGDGTLMKVPLEGGTPVALAKDQGGAHALTLDGTDLYFATATTIRRVPIAFGTPVEVITGQKKPIQGFWLSAQSILWGRGIAGFSEGELVMRAR